MLQGYETELAGRQDGPLAKLKTDIDRFRDRAFLKAAMAVAALTALADGEVSLEERYRIDGIVAREPALAAFNAHKAATIFNDYVHVLRSEPARSRRILMAKIERMAVKPRRARTLMRVSWLIIVADDRVAPGEVAAFDELCRALHLDPDDVRDGVRR